jgi:hypothetical protein
MKRFLLSSLKRRLLVCSAVPFFLVLAWLAVLMLSSLESWRRAGKNSQELVSGGKERCERLYFDKAIHVAPPEDAASTDASTLNQAAESSRLDFLNFSQEHPRIASFTVIPGETSDADAWWRANSAVAGEGYHLDAGRFAERFGLDDGQREYLQQQLTPKLNEDRSMRKVINQS